MNRDTKILIIGAVLILTAALSIGYAALSQNLSISSSAQIASSSWEVGTTLTSSSTPCTYNGNTLTSITPTISGTGTITITIPQVELSLPGDTVVCTVPIKNKGEIDAELTSFTVTPATITTSDSGFDRTKVSATVTYDGSASPTTPVYLAAGNTKNVVITYTFDSSATSVPSSVVNVSGLSVNLYYEQA